MFICLLSQLLNMCDVQYKLCTELRAHATLCCEKSIHRNSAAYRILCYNSSDFTDGHRTHFKLGLPLDTCLKLHRMMGEFEVCQGQPGGRVA